MFASIFSKRRWYFICFFNVSDFCFIISCYSYIISCFNKPCYSKACYNFLTVLDNRLNSPLPPSRFLCDFSKNVFSIERAKPLFFLTFNIALTHIFPENFIETAEVVQKISFNINYFRRFFGFDIYLLQKS